MDYFTSILDAAVRIYAASVSTGNERTIHSCVKDAKELVDGVRETVRKQQYEDPAAWPDHPMRPLGVPASPR